MAKDVPFSIGSELGMSKILTPSIHLRKSGKNKIVISPTVCSSIVNKSGTY